MSTRSKVSKPPWRARLFLMPAALLALGAAVAVAGDWTGRSEIGLGDTATSTFQDRALGGPGEMHAYRFFAPAGTKIEASLAPNKGSNVEVLLQITRDGKVVPIADRIKVKNLRVTLKKLTLEESGFYEYRVTAIRGTGAYTLKTKGKLPKKVKAVVKELTYAFDVVGPTQLKLATVKGAKGTKPVFTLLTGPSGEIAIGEPSKKLKKIDLPETGTYTLTYADTAAAAKKLQPGEWAVQVTLKTPKSKNLLEQPTGQNFLPLAVMDVGDPAAGVAAPGYKGTESCRDCHAEYVEKVLNSFHNSKMRTSFRQGAAEYNVPPTIDAKFRAAGGTDLRTDPDTADKFGSLDYAVRLSYVPGDDLPYKVTIGNNTYDIMYMMGGNGPWKQRYVMKIGASHYISPVQYNEKTGTWAVYHGGDWNADGPTALKNSWERRCGACHATGVLTTFNQATGEYLTGYAQMNVGCEGCHGAGEAHIASQDPDDILNPRDLVNGTTDGNERADMTCGQCHNRGSGGLPTGAPSNTGYPWKLGVGIFVPGGNQADYDTFYTETSGQYWGEKSLDSHNASKKHHQQMLDLANGPHAPDKPWDGVCFDCHNPHADQDVKHMMATELTHSGLTYDVDNDNNSLCFSCHNGHGDYENVSPTDVGMITNDFAPASVVDAVLFHMKDKAAMPVDAEDYDPAGTGTGRCSKCHMPKMAKSADYVPDKAGNPVGDIHSHTMTPVWPNLSELEPITNSCATCHPIDPTDKVGPIIEQWSKGTDADDTTFHADTPRSFQNGVANENGASGGMACAGCHTTEGFLEAQVEGTQADLIEDEDRRNDIVSHSIAFDVGITCRACHGAQPDGTFAEGENPLRFPADQLCGKCHMNETVQYVDYVADGEIVRHPQDQMFNGVEGGQVAGESYGNSFHSNLTCLSCHHNDEAEGDHTFMPKLAACNQSGCHSAENLTDFNRLAGDDYDGNGTVEGMQTEVTGALQVLQDAILATDTSTGAVVTFAAPYYLIDGDRSNTGALDPDADAALMRAMFNAYWVPFDDSTGIHNSRYALQLIQKSYTELTGEVWPGVLK